MMSVIKSAHVIGRRDFVATVYSRTFLLFLLGPLLPIAFGLFFGSMTENMAIADSRPTVAVIAGASDFEAIRAAHERIAGGLPERTLLEIAHEEPDYVLDAQVRELLTATSRPVVAVMTGGLASPRLTGAISDDGSVSKQMRLIVDEARRSGALQRAGNPPPVVIPITHVEESAGTLAVGRNITASLAQTLLFVLTMLLATMLLSNLVEEKSNKVIEVLAAAVPIDSIFLGKLFAMLAISMVGITVWGLAGAAGASIWLSDSLDIPAPAVGWPLFMLFILIYYSASYLLLGALLLGIGAQASSIREVQTLSMPVTMGQLVVFAFATIALGQSGNLIGLLGAAFPFSSPLVMIGRAAQAPELWPHLVAIVWQAFWVWLIVRLGASLFRHSVMKSGGGSARPDKAAQASSGAPAAP